jgi:Uma2 family endonuclease
MIATFRTDSKVSDEDIELLSRLIPPFRFERNGRGELIVSPNGTESGLHSGEVYGQLWSWNKALGAGFAFDSNTGFTMPDGAIYSPDAAWVEKSRYLAFDRAERRKYLKLCPDVVFEVLSPSDRLPSVREKIGEYMRGGSKLSVAIDPFNCIAEVRRFDRDPELLASPTHLILEARYFGAAQRDFVLDLSSLFEA